MLCLAECHKEAAGILPILFGRDGEFENAPNWTGPMALVIEGVFIRWYTVEMIAWPEDGLMNDLFLDARIPTVAMRMLRLCRTVLFDPSVPIYSAAHELLRDVVGIGRGIRTIAESEVDQIERMFLSLTCKIVACHKG